MNKRNLILSIYDHSGNELCPLYDSNTDIMGQAYDVHIKTQRNGWRELSFSIPGNDYRANYIKPDFKIKAEDDDGIEWYLMTQPRVTHSNFSKTLNVTAGHVSQLLKNKNMALEFSDDEGNNIGTCEELLTTILDGTGWQVGDVTEFREKNGSIKKRSLVASAKTGAFKLITKLCELFEAKPIFRSHVEKVVDGTKVIIKTVDIKPMNPFSQAKNDIYENVKTYADGDVTELHYGTNVSNVTRTQKTDELKTVLYAYGAYGDTISKFCAINECKHTEIKFTLTDDLEPGIRYYFEVDDDSGVKLKRYIQPTVSVPSGTVLTWSFLDPASLLYMWDGTNAHRVYEGIPRYEATGYNISESDMVFGNNTDADYDVSVDSSSLNFSDLFFVSGDTAVYNGDNNWIRDENNKNIEVRNGAPLPCTIEILRHSVDNVFSFIMDFGYYNECGLLSDEMLNTLAEFQRNAPEYLNAISEATTAYTESWSELNNTIGEINFVKLRPVNVGNDNGDIKITLHEDKYWYNTDYDSKNPFKWRVANAIKDNGDAINTEAAIVYILHLPQNENDILTYDRFYLKTVDDIEDPHMITLWGDSNKASIQDEFYLFETNGVNGLLGVYEESYNSLKESLSSATKNVTVQHPTFFSKVEPVFSVETGKSTVLDEYRPEWANFSREWAWWYKYKDDNFGELYFCDYPVDSNHWRKVYVDAEEPASPSNTEYWYNWRTSVVCRRVNGSWEQLDDPSEETMVSQFGTVYSACLRRDRYFIGEYQKYILENNTQYGLIAGNYYIPGQFKNYWLFSTEFAAKKIVIDTTTNGFATITPVNTELAENSVGLRHAQFDNVFYHKKNIFDILNVEEGNIVGTTGADDDSAEGYRSNYIPVYPNLTYTFSGIVGTVDVYFYNLKHVFLYKTSIELTGSNEPGIILPNNTRYLRVASSVDITNISGHFMDWETSIIADEETYYLAGEAVGSGELKGIDPLIAKFYAYADLTYMTYLNAIKDAQAAYNEIESEFKNEMGDLYREGWWQDSKYVDGDEDKLYDDALDNLKEIAKPECTYNIDFLDLRCADFSALGEDLVLWPDFNVCCAAHLIDPEINVNCWAYVDTIDKWYDKPWQTTISINTNLNTASQHTFTDVMTNIANVASIMKGKDTVYDRAVNITETGKWTAEKLEGTIDADKLKITGGASTWYTDEKGNMIFESSDGQSAMMISGNGFALANDKDKYGEWIFRSFGTGNGFSADEITTGTLSANRIAAGSITTNHVSSDFGDELDISSNKGIKIIVGDLENGIDVTNEMIRGVMKNVSNQQTQIAQTSDKISLLVSGDSTSELSMTDNALTYISKNLNLNLNDGLQLTLDTVDAVNRWIDFGENGMRQGKEGSDYSTFIDEYGYHIDKAGMPEGEHVSSFSAEGLRTNGIKIGNISCRATTSGGWVWTK